MMNDGAAHCDNTRLGRTAGPTRFTAPSRPLSRRGFLAVSARVAVAVSGSSILTSCTSGSTDARSPVDLSPAARIAAPPPTVDLANDGSDQSRRLQLAIDSTPDGATVALPSGRFRIDRRITVQNRQNLLISGPSTSAPFIGYTDLTGLDVNDLTSNRSRRNSQRAHWLISGGRGVTLRNIRVEGPNDERNRGYARSRLNLAFEHAFSTRDATVGVTFTQCTYRNVYGDGVYIGGTGAPNRDVRISDVTGAYSGRQGFAVVNVDGLVAERISCDYAWGVGFDLEPNEDSATRNVTLRDMRMGAAHFPYSFGGPGDASFREQIILDGCSAIRSGSKSAAIWGRSPGNDLTITNHIDDRVASDTGIMLAGWNTARIRGCRVVRPPGLPGVAVKLDRCTGPIEITDNDFHDYSALIGGVAVPTDITTSGNTWDSGRARD